MRKPVWIFQVIVWLLLAAGPDLNFGQITLRESGAFVFGALAGMMAFAWVIASTYQRFRVRIVVGSTPHSRWLISIVLGVKASEE